MKPMTAALLLTLACLALSSNHFLVGDEPSSDAAEKLVPLQVERERLAAEFGANHPRVKQVDREIELMRKLLSEAAATRDTRTVNQNELLATVQRLTERVDALERELAALKARMSQSELLSR